MSKNKLLHFIGTKIFTDIQELSISVYVEAMKEKDYNFDGFFELNYKDIINESLEYLDIVDVERYKETYYNILKDIYILSKKNAVDYVKFGTSNRKVIFDYWTKNQKLILQKIIDIKRIDN